MTLNFKRLCYFYRDYPFSHSTGSKKKKNRPKMESFLLSPTSANLTSNLTAISTSPRNGSFNQTILNFLACTREVIFLIDPTSCPLKKDEGIYSFPAPLCQ